MCPDQGVEQGWEVVLAVTTKKMISDQTVWVVIYPAFLHPFCGGGRQQRANAKPNSPVRATTTENEHKVHNEIRSEINGSTGRKN